MNNDEVPLGTVGMVDEQARLKQIEHEAVKFASRSAASDAKHHLLSAQEDWEEQQKEDKRKEIQERARQRITEAEHKDPSLRAKNPGLLE